MGKPGVEDSPEDIKRKCAERKAQRAKKLGKSMTRTGNPRGRPKGGSLVVKKFNDLAESGDAGEAVNVLLSVAKDPDHRNWAAAQKMLLDRVANISHFEKGSSTGQVAVNINIGTVGGKQGDVIEGEVVDES